MRRSFKVVSTLIVVFTLISLFTTSAFAVTVTNAEMLDMASRTCDYLTSYGEVPSKIYTTSTHTDSVTPAEFYYMMARWLRYYKNNGTTPATVAIIRATSGPSGISGVESGTIQQVDILAKGESNANYIDTNSQLPNYSTVGSTQYTTKAMFSVFARTINWYQDHDETLPNYATVSAVTSPDAWDWARTISGVPYYGQPDGYTCGPTSCSMVIDYFGSYYSPYTIGYYMRDYLGDSPWYDGVVKSTIVGALTHYGLSNAHSEYGWTDLKTAISKDIPVVAYVESWINPGGYHYVVVVGLTKTSDGHCSTVIVNDPSNSGGGSGYLTRDGANFDSHWTSGGNWIAVPKYVQ